MRVKVRDVIDLDANIDASRLKPLQRITTGFLLKYRESGMYKRRLERKLEQEFKERSKREEKLEGLLLEFIYTEFMLNNTAGKLNTTTKIAYYDLQRRHGETLPAILKKKSLIDYNVKVLECNSDLLRSFKDIPIRLEITRKFPGGRPYEEA